jgi:hypothetical protein
MMGGDITVERAWSWIHLHDPITEDCGKSQGSGCCQSGPYRRGVAEASLVILLHCICRLMAHRDISLRRINSVAIRAKRTFERAAAEAAAHATSSAQFAIDPLHGANANTETCCNLAHAGSVLFG